MYRLLGMLRSGTRLVVTSEDAHRSGVGGARGEVGGADVFVEAVRTETNITVALVNTLKEARKVEFKWVPV